MDIRLVHSNLPVQFRDRERETAPIRSRKSTGNPRGAAAMVRFRRACCFCSRGGFPPRVGVSRRRGTSLAGRSPGRRSSRVCCVSSVPVPSRRTGRVASLMHLSGTTPGACPCRSASV